jgi:hypothetical protein
VHAVEDVHDTPPRLGYFPVGLGVVWTDHSVPFHRSASVMFVPELLMYWPTAIQAVDDVQDTPIRLFLFGPGFEVVSIDHSVPFHRSASVVSVPIPEVSYPTAMHAVEDVQDTLCKMTSNAPEGLGTPAPGDDHSIPFQISADAR